MKLLSTLLFIILLSVAAHAQTDKPCPQSFIDRCTDAANQLAAAQVLIDAQKQEIAALKERVLLEQQRAQLYKEAFELSRQQREDYIQVSKLKDDIIAAKDKQLQLANDTIEKLAAVKKESFWSKVGKEVTKVLIYVGVAAIATK